MSKVSFELLSERTKLFNECKKAKEDQDKNKDGFFPMMLGRFGIGGNSSQIPSTGPLLITGGSSAGGMFWRSNIDVFDFQKKSFIKNIGIDSGQLTPNVRKVFQVDSEGDVVGMISNVRTVDYKFSEFKVMKLRNKKEEENETYVTKFSAHSNVVCNDAIIQNERLYTCGGDGRINIFDLSNITDKSTSIKDRKLHHFESKLIQSNICINDSSTNLGCGHPKGFDLYDLKEMKQVFTTEVPNSERWVNASGSINENIFAFSSGEELFLVDSREKKLVEKGKICESEIWSFKALNETLFAVGDNGGDVKILDHRKDCEAVLTIPKFAEDYMKVNDIILITNENESLMCVCNVVRVFVYDFRGKCHGCYIPVQTADCVTFVDKK